MPRVGMGSILLGLAVALLGNSALAGQRTFVASIGSDANTASNCGPTTPCRSFTAALSVTSNGGEIVALDAAGYGAVSIDRSVTITANPGYYAGIASASGSAVTISTASVKVVLRNLNIHGTGASIGIDMSAGSYLS